MKSRHPNLDWIRKVLVDGEASAGDLQAPLVPCEMPEDAEAVPAAGERGNVVRLFVLDEETR
jgi:hypothetical protein